MKQAIILAGAAALAFTGAAHAKPPHAKHGKGHAPAVHGPAGNAGYGVGGCPPGLAKKNELCMPPGQYKKLFEVGQRVPSGYEGLLGYNGLPYDVRNHYGSGLDANGRYIYDQDHLYRVDPKTMIVREILRAVL